MGMVADELFSEYLDSNFLKDTRHIAVLERN